MRQYIIVTTEMLKDIKALLEDGDLVGALQNVKNILEIFPVISLRDDELRELLKMFVVGEAR